MHIEVLATQHVITALKTNVRNCRPLFANYFSANNKNKIQKVSFVFINDSLSTLRS